MYPVVIFKLSITILPAPRNSNWFLNTGVAKGVPFDTPSTDLEGEHRGVTEMEGGLGPESSSAYLLLIKEAINLQDVNLQCFSRVYPRFLDVF
jgi:hypothetical protein